MIEHGGNDKIALGGKSRLGRNFKRKVRAKPCKALHEGLSLSQWSPCDDINFSRHKEFAIGLRASKAEERISRDSVSEL